MANAKIKQFWLVVPLDIKADPNVPTVGTNQQPDFAAEVAQPRNRLQVGAVPESNGLGWAIAAPDLKRMRFAFTTKQAANDYAKDQAEKSPKTLFGVFACDGTYETTTPTVIQKSFNEDGELTPVKV